MQNAAGNTGCPLKLSRRQTGILAFSGAALVAVLVLVYSWGRGQLRKARALQQAIANPQHIEPGPLLNEIAGAFQDMSDAQKKALLADPVATEKLIAETTNAELKKSFSLLFMLPPSMREKLIRESAENLRRTAREKPEKVAAFFDSPGGNGALRGASQFFLLDLSGKQKVEAQPLLEAMADIVKTQARRKAAK